MKRYRACSRRKRRRAGPPYTPLKKRGARLLRQEAAVLERVQAGLERLAGKPLRRGQFVL